MKLSLLDCLQIYAQRVFTTVRVKMLLAFRNTVSMLQAYGSCGDDTISTSKLDCKQPQVTSAEQGYMDVELMPSSTMLSPWPQAGPCALQCAQAQLC